MTGGSKKNTKYINTKLKSPAPYRGMCAREYQEVVLSQLAAAGNQLFSGRRRYVRSWQLQQDGAKQHTTADSLSTVRALVPGGAFEWWLANSPDLSLIENVWAWMDAQLRLRPQCMTVEELKEALAEIVQRLMPSFLQPLTACRGASRLALPPTVQPSNWHECPDGQNTFDCPKLLDSYCLHLENSYPELTMHTMPGFPATAVDC